MIFLSSFLFFFLIVFLREKSKIIEYLKIICTIIQIEKGLPIVRIKTKKIKELDNVDIDHFCEYKGVKYEFSTPRTPQQNGVLKRKNCVLHEMACAMLYVHDTHAYLWVEAIALVCYITNRVFLKPMTKKTTYKL